MTPPLEAEQQEGMVWELLVTAYGLEEAMMEFDDHFSEVSSNLPHKFTRCSGDPLVFVGFFMHNLQGSAHRRSEAATHE